MLFVKGENRRLKLSNDPPDHWEWGGVGENKYLSFIQ